jgi:prepilin-type N-terminal cleavage/methylation domain-containing protein
MTSASIARVRTRKARSAGFTMLEMMVAMTVGGIAISSMYAIGSASTRHFREQQRVSTAQSSLRVAMNQVKRDLQRAGYLGTPNVAVGGRSCVGDPGSPLNDTGTARDLGRLAAISAYHRAVTPRPTFLDPANLNAWATVDELILMANYSTSGEYRGVQLNVTRDAVTIPVTSQSFRRDFSHWYAAGGQAAGSCNQTALQAAFAPGRLVRVHGRDDRYAFAISNGANCAAAAAVANITFTQPLSTNCTGVGTGWISPLNTIRYRVQNAAGVEDSRTTPGTVAVLRRTEVNPAAKQNNLMVTIGGVQQSADDRVVLDHVVRFSVEFLLTNASNAPRTLNYVPATQAAVQGEPQRVRGAIVELVVRTPEHESEGSASMPAVPALPAMPALRPFRLSNTRGAARTRSLRAELLLPNVAFEGL